MFGMFRKKQQPPPPPDEPAMSDDLLHRLQQHLELMRVSAQSTDDTAPYLANLAADLQLAIEELIRIKIDTGPSPRDVYQEQMRKFQREEQ